MHLKMICSVQNIMNAHFQKNGSEKNSDPFSKNALLIFLITVVEQHI